MDTASGHIRAKVWESVRSAFPPAIRTALWLIRLTVPITLGIAVMQYLGVVQWISVQLTPLFASMGLGGEAALVYLSAALGNIYTAIAVMFTVGVDYRSAVILSVMALICHNLIIETAIQRRSGASALWMPALRIAMSLACGWMLHRVLPAGITGQLHSDAGAVAQAASWGGLIAGWAQTLWPLLVRMVVLITALNILQSILRNFGVLDLIAWPLRPLMRVFGLPLSTSFLWIICNVIGLAYGGAALIDELERGTATQDDARLLHTHVALSHSQLEDTLLFASIGLPLFWLVVPRLALAVAAVWVQRAARQLKYSPVQHSGT